MKVTAGTNERKKVMALGGLLAIAAVVWFINRTEGPAPAQAPAFTAPVTAPRVSPAVAARRADAINAAVEPARASVNRSGKVSSSTQEFRPTLKPRDANERIDPATIDPTLRLEMLAALKKVSLEGTGRNLFDFSNAPPPVVKKQLEPVIPIKGTAVAGIPGGATPPPASGEQPKPPPPPIPLKFYGFTNPARSGAKRAFFLDGEDIVVATEGDMIKKRYKVIRIGLSSAVVEDTEIKNQQTLPLVAEMAG
ncbi:MAG: hypothetical protein ABI693_06530 [Bryobacteraceae bacterium]